MFDMLGDNGSKFIIAAAAVAVGLLLLALVLWFMKNRPSSAFIRGGKNRQPRLAVLDAAAVDTRRRLVLIRRDDVEHLIMIGGPTDIVIETRIGMPPLQEPAALPAQQQVRQPESRQIENRQPEARQAEQRQADPRSESRPQVQPQAVTRTETRVESRQDPKPAPVSAMGQILYSEADEVPLRQQRPAPDTRAIVTPVVTPVQQRSLSEPQQRPVQARPEDTTAAQGPGAAALIRTPTSNPTSMTPSLDAEDILDAARSRVLPRQTVIGPANVVGNALPSQRDPSAQVQPAVQKEPSSDFERILDAEISGDLQRLAPVGPQDGIRQGATPQRTTERQEPQLTLPANAPITGARSEPTIEQEMARMLGEMSVKRNT